MKVKILGAGSIGNHLAQACRRKSWKVTVVDPDPKALERMKTDIYPMRYGEWDNTIELSSPEAAPKGGFDIIMIGTPPHVRMKLALEALQEKPKLIQLEKPYFIPMIDDEAKAENEEFLAELKKHDTKVVVGYEYALGESANKIAKFINNSKFGEVKLHEMAVREEWSGIFSAHHWLSGPQDSYLGFWQKGGGASGEHSHAIHYWQYFAFLLNLGTASQVSAAMNIVKTDEVNYDSVSYMNVITDRGFLGRIIQDVVTDPPCLELFIQRERGYVKWLRRGIPGRGNVETIYYGEKKDDGKWEKTEEEIVVKRPDDFYHEICEISDILEGKTRAEDSVIGLQTGVLATRILTAAHKSRMNDGKFTSI